MKSLFFIGDILKKYPKLLIVGTLLVISLSVVEACSLITIGPLIDLLINPDLEGTSQLTKVVVKTMHSIGLPVRLEIYLIIFLVFISLSSSLRIFVRHSVLKIKYAVQRDLILGTFNDFFNARWYFFTSGKQGVLLNTFMRELGIAGDAFRAIPLFFSGFLQLFFCLAIPFYISWQVTMASLVTILFLVWPFLLLGKISYRLGRRNTATANQVGIVMQEGLELAKVILGFGNQRKSYNHLQEAFDDHRNATIKSQTLGFSIPAMYQPLGVIVLSVALFTARRFGIPLSETAVLLLALWRAVFSFGQLAASKHSLENFFPSYEQIENLRKRAKELKQPSGNKKFIGFEKEIKLKDISFAYPEHDPVLANIYMTITKGKMIAVVGESGAGKSTLIDTIMGFNEPLSGKVSFDGVDLREFEINSYRRRIGYVPQDAVLFNMSIRDNLLWANQEASDQDIKYACLQANADEFIKKFPYGYDTLVGDRGVCLSGGQRQRIALARAILRRPQLLILDEATSSLDTHSERLIQVAIENIAKETTIIVIAHRLSTIVNADYVYVLKSGRIIEQGLYSSLAKKDGYFNQMVKLQLLQTLSS